MIFCATAHNANAHTQYTLNYFCQDVASFKNILSAAHQSGYFLNHKSVDYDMKKFLAEYIPDARKELLLKTPVQLLTQALPEEYKNKKPCSLTHLPPAAKEFTSKIQLYITLLCDVLNNELAKRDYEAGIPHEENVSERAHGLQAGKFSALFGLPQDVILAMYFHDISRPTHPDVTHGHEHHHQEGSTVLAPLGLSTDYTRYHAYGKFLLNAFCPRYQDLISPVSKHSLALQEKLLQTYLNELETISSSQELAKFIYKMMFLRLIDDISKVPALLIPSALVEYFDDDMIKQMLLTQITKHLMTEKALSHYEEKLDKALVLMHRAAEFSDNPILYGLA